MLLNIVLLFIVLVSSASALFVPPRPNYARPGQIHGLARRNDTAAMAGELSLNIDPDIVNPKCGDVVDANINVAYTPDEFYLSEPCQRILDYIGGNRGNKDVSVNFACLGQDASTSQGLGDKDIKFIFNLVSTANVNGANSGTQLVPSNLELVNGKDNILINAQVNLGVKMGNSKATFQYIYC